MAAREPQTLDLILPEAARSHPERGIGIYDRRGRGVERRTYPELEAAVRARAGRLASRGLEPGGALPVSLDTSWELIETWLAAVSLGARPVAIAPTGAMGSGAAHLRKLASVMETVEATRIVAAPALREDAEREGFPDLARAVLTEEELAATPEMAPASRERRETDPEEIAFFQLTSGSTGHPRAVIVQHRAVLHNLRAIEEGISEAWSRDARAAGSSVVSWLPLHHDMGLVGCLLATIRAAVDLWLLPPRLFLARPESWIRALCGRGAVVSSAPNFGYQSCTERAVVERPSEGDLSEWHTALVGAEMVRSETMARFATHHAELGFDPRALRPCYGLAEATLAVTFDVRNRGVRTHPVPHAAGEREPHEVSCVGAPVLDTEVRVVAPDQTRLSEGAVGEVEVRGPGLFGGYHRDPQATGEALRAGWLRTGDLGFLHEGELYLTGRMKELLVLRGQNLMPHELEWCAESEVGGEDTARAGAFSVDAGSAGEQAVVAVEVSATDPARLAELERGVRVRVGRQLGLTLADVVFLRRGRIPRTTSGKVQRGELRRRYLAGELQRIPGTAEED